MEIALNAKEILTHVSSVGLLLQPELNTTWTGLVHAKKIAVIQTQGFTTEMTIPAAPVRILVLLANAVLLLALNAYQGMQIH